MGSADEAVTSREDELKRTTDWRYKQARKLGCSKSDARRFSISEGDIGLLRQLVTRGCSTPTAVEIVV